MGHFDAKKVLERAKILHVKKLTEMGLEFGYGGGIVAGDDEIVNIHKNAQENTIR